MPIIPPSSPRDEAPYERVALMDIPLVFANVRAAAARLTDLDFRSLMTPLLRQCCGLAGVAYAACTAECTLQDLKHTLEVLSDYLQAALALMGRYQTEQEAARDRETPVDNPSA